jgi:hypothetical protein
MICKAIGHDQWLSGSLLEINDRKYNFRNWLQKRSEWAAGKGKCQGNSGKNVAG